jgi:hypothetical protein
MKSRKLMGVLALGMVGLGLTGCSQEPVPQPSASAPVPPPKQQVIDNPNVPESVKQQMRGGAR